MSKYKIIVRSPNWRIFDACTLGVSVTSPSWQNDYFASILDFASENFDTIRIDVSDLLYRHSFMACGLSSHDAALHAEALGASWLTRHDAIINACPLTPAVIRWGTWYKHPDYTDVWNGFARASSHSKLLKEAIERDVDEFFRRQGRRPHEAERQHSRDCFIEELAIFTLQARALPSLKLYPGKELNCTNVVRRRLVPEAPQGLEREQYARIKFHTRAGHNVGLDLPAMHAPERLRLADRRA